MIYKTLYQLLKNYDADNDELRICENDRDVMPFKNRNTLQLTFNNKKLYLQNKIFFIEIPQVHADINPYYLTNMSRSEYKELRDVWIEALEKRRCCYVEKQSLEIIDLIHEAQDKQSGILQR